MKKSTFLLTGIIILGGLLPAVAQTSAASDIYTDYQHYFSDIKFGFPGKRAMMQDLKDSAALLTDETPPAGNKIKLLSATTKVLADEEIYARRKNSVFIVGKLQKAKDSTDALSFGLTGTAFALNPDGICVTNYHVLKSIIVNDNPEAAKDSVYFIIAHDKQVYFIEKILAYSQNNDLAIFKVNTNGTPLQPIPVGKPAEVGTAVYCISHPTGYFYYFSKGIVARNVTIGARQAAAGYNPLGKPPIRMEITADYGVGSSGGPVLDKRGNLIGIVSSTLPLGAVVKDDAGNVTGHQQMVIKDTLPVSALQELLGN
ncbi:Trypsin-like peptidase domain-containing protein [Chitinophaga ginsengisegetis]|uniref:Trypsin-like peptidase domain-containing protein n=1 Tax=Chitinophaga ginsengisegetis TaxID=393003 RepID=A0A1T5PAQ6_9BACT|nr:serine protease [Chitinophaga ginsengisegetis]SKD09756.1 Trypsin-like peptidase domain-containing protein [Chitinophaga ginsengisegetis]